MQGYIGILPQQLSCETMRFTVRLIGFLPCEIRIDINTGFMVEEP